IILLLQSPSAFARTFALLFNGGDWPGNPEQIHEKKFHALYQRNLIDFSTTLMGRGVRAEDILIANSDRGRIARLPCPSQYLGSYDGFRRMIADLRTRMGGEDHLV